MSAARRVRGGPARGSVAVPPSKSLSNRYLNLALLSAGETRIERLLVADDTQVFLQAIGRAGRDVSFGEPSELGDLSGVAAGVGDEVSVRIGPEAPPDPGREAEIWCGASGTMLRFVLAALAARPGRWHIDGTPRLRERPVGALVEALRSLGAEIEYLGEKGAAPLEVVGGSLDGGVVSLDAGDSSQYASALLMAGLRAVEPIEIELSDLVSSPYLDLTVQAIADVGGRAEWDGTRRCRVEPGISGADGPRHLRVEGDFSSACYFAAGAAVAGGRVELHGLGQDSRQGDRGFLGLLSEMGARVGWRGDVLEVEGARGVRLTAIERDLSDLPDQVPTLAALAPFAHGTTRITGVPHLRLKESDRLAGMAAALRQAGAEVTEEPDGLVIPGVWAERPGGVPTTEVTLDPRDDHRLAMSFAVLGLGREGVTVGTPDVVAKSYPGFWGDFGAVFAP